MKYGIVAALLAGMVGCAWFDGDDDDDRRTGHVEPADRVDGVDRVDGMDREGAVKVGFDRDEALDEELGDTAIDPVSGEVVRQRTTHTMQWKGLTYYFDSEDNREAFEDNPEQYVTEEGYLKRSMKDARREAEVK